MKKSIRIAATLLSVTLAVAITGCGKEKEAVKETAKKKVVTVWSGNGHDKAFLNEKIAEWNKTEGAKKGVEIDYIVHSTSLDQKLELAFETGQAPDLFTSGMLAQFAEKGNIIPFEDIPGAEKLIEKYDDYCMYMRHLYNGGKHYSLPKTAATYGIIYNKDMFKKAGIVDEKGEPTPPETLEEYCEYAKKLTNPAKKEYGVIFPAKAPGWYGDDVMKMSSASSGFCDSYDPKSGKYDATYESIVMKALMQIKADGSCYPGAEGLDNDQARARFGAGGIGMKTAGSYDFGVLTTQFPASIEWGVAPYPVADKNDKRKQYMGNNPYLLISKSAEEKAEQILPVLEFFYGDELIIDSYKSGIDIPLNWELVKDIKVDKKMQQWADFAKLVNISQSTPLPIGTKTTADVRSLRDIWLEDVWTGKVTGGDIDKACEEYAIQKNNGIPVYQSEHPQYDPSVCIFPDWDSSRKD